MNCSAIHLIVGIQFSKLSYHEILAIAIVFLRITNIKERLPVYH